MFRGYYSFFNLYLLYLILGAIFRVAYSELFHNFDELHYIIIYGLRMDTIIFSVISIPALILFIFRLNQTIKFYYALTISSLIVFEVVSVFYFSTFFQRPNYLLIEYMEYPEDVFNMIWDSFQINILMLIVIFPILVTLFYKMIEFEDKQRAIPTTILLILLLIGARSSFSSSAPNPSFYNFSKSEISNEIANNSLFSLAYDFYASKKDKSLNFGEIDDRIAVKNLQKLGRNGTLKSLHDKKEKILLIQLESFGKDFVGILGGEKMTPNIDRWSKEGVLFSNMHSTGMRTNRGVEAIISSIPPSPSRTYLKRLKSQRDFWTVAEPLNRLGYRTVFLYGGDSKFDNMRSFLLSNGFNEIIDIYDFGGEEIYGWGVPDEVLLKRAEKILKESKKPIFLYTVTLTSHEPFLYPKGKIDINRRFSENSFANSTKYTDFAVGKLLDSLDIDNMAIGLIGDHPPKVKSDRAIPVDSFQVFGLILGSIKGECSQLSSQIDFIPTLLDVAGVSTDLPAFGVSLLQNRVDRAMMTYRKSFAYLKSDHFILYQDGKKPRTFNLNYEEIEQNRDSIDDGLSYLNLSEYLYQKGDYK